MKNFNKTLSFIYSIFIMAVFCLAQNSVMAQSIICTGTVTDASGNTLPGATIEISDLSIGTAANDQGVYTLELPSDEENEYSITARYIGYEPSTQNVALAAGTNTINFILASSSFNLGQIEVSALKTGATIASETPLSISAFEGKQIESIGANTISDFIQNAPGVTTTQLDESFISLQIRGISTLSGDSPAGYYMDESPFTFIGSPLAPDLNPFDLKRVEVLRGPQGTLYGNGAQSGVVRVLTNDAEVNNLEVKADLTGGTTKDGGNNYGAQGAVNLPIIKDKIALRMTGGYRQLGGFISNDLLGLEEINESKLHYFRGKINFKLNDNLNVKTSFWTQDNDVGTYTLADENYDHSTPFYETNTNNFKIYNVTIEYDLPKLKLYSSTSYTDMESRIYDGSPIFARSDSDLAQTALNEELRVSSKNSGAFNWLLGAYYWNGTFDQTTSITFILPDGTLFESPYLESESTSRQLAGFGELYYKFMNNKMQLTLGGRYYTEERGLTDQLQSTVEVLNLLGIDANRSTKYNVFTPRVNLSYAAAKNAIVYATASNGFRSGLVQNGAFLSSGIVVGIAVPEFVNEENLWSYELGTKLSNNSKSVSVEAAVYYNDWQDLIQTSSEIVDVGGTPTPIIFFVNAGNASALGLDFTSSISNQKGLTFSVGGNINNSVYKDDTPATIGAKDGDRISFVPKYTFSSSINYRKKLNEKLTAIFYTNLQHNSERIDYREGMVVSGDANTMLNARFGVEFNSVGIYIFGNNLLNEGGATYPHNLLTYSTRLRPTTFGINLKFNY